MKQSITQISGNHRIPGPFSLLIMVIAAIAAVALVATFKAGATSTTSNPSNTPTLGSKDSITTGHNGDAAFKASATPRMLAQTALSLGTSRAFMMAAGPAPVAPVLAGITVNTTVDENNTGADCSLREAIVAANTDAAFGGCTAGSGSDTITFSVTGTINLSSALPHIFTSMSINGPGANQLTVERSADPATPEFRVFTVFTQVAIIQVQIGGLTISNGRAVVGGGIENSGGTNLAPRLTVMNCAITGNDATIGGGVSNSGGGNLTVVGSTISGNSASSDGGGIRNGAFGRATIINSTISGNKAARGGGIDDDGFSVTFMTLTNCTITNNTATNPSFASGLDTGNPGTTVGNTIIAGNLGPGPELSGVCRSQGHNLISSDGSNGFTNGSNGDQVGVAVKALLSPLANNGGPTRTHALVNPGSPALDGGDNALATNAGLTTDQRGLSRFVDGPDADTTATVDIGAYESNSGASIEDIPDRTMTQDTSVSFNFNIGGGVSVTSVTASSSNTALVPNNSANLNVIFAPHRSEQTLTITPAAGQVGMTTITVTVNTTGGSAFDTFILTVNPPLNTPPSFTRGPDQTVPEDSGPRSIPNWATNISAGSGNESGQTLTFLVQNNTNPSLFSAGPAVSSTGTLTYTPATDAYGIGTITIALMDNAGGSNTSSSQTFVVTVTEVNDVPVAANDSFASVAEDSAPRTISFAALVANDSAGPANESGQTFTVKAVSNAVGGTIRILGGNVVFTPTANYNGPARFSYTIEDNGTTNGVADPKTSAAATVSFNITAVADTPSVTNATTNANTQTTSGLVISRNPADGAEVTHFKITGITGGTLFKNNGTTVINNGDFITFAEGNAGLKFTPGTVNGSFTVQASLSGSDAGLGGGTATATITVNSVGGVIRFSATNYSVAEGAGFKTITLERTGDTSQPVTVDYASSDHSNPADFIPCTAAGAGFASSRCDFPTAIGTLRFAAGETSQTFNVLISQDNYVEGTETLELTLSNPTGGAVFGVPQTAILSILDDATEPATNPIDTASEMVRSQYHDFLHREPDGPGLAFWTDNIEKCNDAARRPAGQTIPQCIDKQRESTAIAFFMSPEFQITGGFVYHLYKGSLTGAPNYDGGSPGRFPTSLEFMADVNAVSEGIVVNNQISGAVVEANRNRLAAEFVQRPEFVAKYGALNNTLYVQELFNTTGIAATAADKQALVDGLTGGTETRASVLRKVVDGTVVISESNVQFTTTYGQAFSVQENRRVFVFMEYVGYLRRNPDQAGFVFWLGKLNTYNGDPFAAEMVRSFILAPEYRQRFGQP